MAEDVHQKIVNYLKTCNDSKSEFSKIKSELHLEKKVINRQLFLLKRKNIVKRLQDTPPIWQLVEKGLGRGGRSPHKKTSPNKTSPKLQSESQTGSIHPESRIMSGAGPVRHEQNYAMARGRSRGREGRGRDKWVKRGGQRNQRNQGPSSSPRPSQTFPATQSSQNALQSEVFKILHSSSEPLTEKKILDRIGHYVVLEHVNSVLKTLMHLDQVVRIESSHGSSFDTYALKLSVDKIRGSNSTEMEFEYEENVSEKTKEGKQSEQIGQTSGSQTINSNMNDEPGLSENPSRGGSSQECSTSAEQILQDPAHKTEFSSLGFEPTTDQDDEYMDEDYDEVEDDEDDEEDFKWNEKNIFNVPDVKSDLVLKTLCVCPLGVAKLFVLAGKLKEDEKEIEIILKRLLSKKLVQEIDSSQNVWGTSDKGKSYLIENGLILPSVVNNPNHHNKSDASHFNQLRSSSVSGAGPPKDPMELTQTNTVFNQDGACRSNVPGKNIGSTEHLPQMQSDTRFAMSADRFGAPHIYTGIGRGQQLIAMMPQASHGLFAGTAEKPESSGPDEKMPPPVLPVMHVNSPNAPCFSRNGKFAENKGNLSKQGQLPGNSVIQEASMASSSVTKQASSLSSIPSPRIPLTPKELLSKEANSENKSLTNSGGLSSNDQAVFPTSSSCQRSQESNFTASSSSSSFTPVAAGVGVKPQVPSLSGLANNLSINSESFSAVNKNPISALMEYAQSRHMTAKIEVVSQHGPPHKPTFIIAAIIGDRVFPGVKANNKKDGRTEAADLALRALLSEGQYKINQQTSVASTPNTNMTHFDKMAALSHQAFNQLIATIPEKFAGRKVVAALIMKTSREDTGTVISVGSGNRCITGEQLSLEGNTVNDSHAEIITRRGFLRFLYKQLETYSSGKHHELFEDGGAGKLRIKSTITFHLYISTAPCGDGALFSPRDAASNRGAIEDVENHDHHPTFTSNVQGLLRTKMEGGEGTIPIEPDFIAQTWDGIIRGERLRTMSCTDKICRWNIVGLQGALLSHFIHPVYLNSLTLGYLYDHGHLARAVCCRAGKGEPDISTQLPSDYHLNHPWLGRMTACEPQRETQKTKALSINWCHGDERPEVIDGTQGRCYTGVEKHFFSRICKKELFQRFKSVCAKFGRSELVNIPTYLESKRKATDFGAAKGVMLKRLKDNGFGTWVSKPVEEEMFTAESS